ncbi:MAG: SGNH/GDSL hydrolase family protein [Actinobacteria bacterium]|nr:MAG: SGNH/GDSL hydrolase family protein [Actinomycetota bacterium]
MTITRPHLGILAARIGLVALVLLALCSVFSRESSAAEWEELPVVPALEPPVVGHLEKVVSRGQVYGNQPGVFAKIGDSITASPSFLQGLACWAPRLGTWGELRGTLEFFGETPVPRGVEEAQCPVSNSFSRLGVAAVGGWRVVDALSPRESLPECEGLPAVSCELQLLHPSIALIMFGTNDLEDFNAVEFRRELARLARLVSSAGTIPVLSTIPPRAQPRFSPRVARFNAEIAALAENRALPLWNFWRQMTEIGVPGLGLSEDGVHPSALCPPCTAVDFRPGGLRYGYALRNLGALRVLDRLRRQIATSADQGI